MDDRLWRPKEAAEYLGLSEATLAKKRSCGGGPPYRKLGRAVRYSPDDLRRWTDERMRGSTSEARPAP